MGHGLIQENLVGLEGKALDFFFKSVNIWDRKMFYTSFWKTASLEYLVPWMLKSPLTSVLNKSSKYDFIYYQKMTWTLSTKSHENWQKLIFFGQCLAEYGQCAMQWFGIPFQGPENCVHPRDSLSDCINRFRNATKWRAIWAIVQWSM